MTSSARRRRIRGGRPWRLVPAAVTVIALAATAAGCSASGSLDAGPTSTTRATTTSTPAPTTPPPATRPTAPGSTTTPAAGPVRWGSCDGGFECAEVEVPVDDADPAGPTLTLGMVRRRAAKPDQRIGILFVNPGGPGASATEFAEILPLPRSVTDRFDIIGLDPRGVGRSDGLDCHRHLLDIYDADPSPDSPTERQSFIDVSQAFVDECAQKYGALLPHLGTVDVARDMDRVRAALGEEQISYLGYSYGTSIGQQYARLFPDRVRAMVLDGVVDTDRTGLESAAAQAAGFQRTLDAYVEACDARGCGLGGSARTAIDDVLAKAESAPIPSETADRPATPGVVNLALWEAFYTPSLWSDLSYALREAQQGNGDGLVGLADRYLGLEDDGGVGFEIYFAVSCLDQTWPDDPQEVLDTAARVAKGNPEIGAGIVNDYLRCALWPAPPQPLEPIPTDIRGLPPVVVVSTTGDPATPHEGAVRVAGSIPGAVLVTNHGYQHTIYAQGKSCIDQPVTNYLVTVEAPAAGIECD